MAYYVRQGSTFRVTDEKNLDIYEKLPVGNYVIKVDMMTGQMFLDSVDNFEFKGKRYGDNTRNTDRILNTFISRDVSTGVMLVGEKGSGKSLLAKTVCMAAAERGIPTIIINTPYHGDQFNTFIQSLDQPVVILFDEFEKVYDQEEQESILTLLDGVFPTKKLFVLTSNDKWGIDRHMRNRPGRIFYMMEFTGVDREFIVEYCIDNLLNKSYIDKICTIASLFANFNFDMLKALVEEMNRYDEAPEQALKYLNCRTEFEAATVFTVKVFKNGELQNVFCTYSDRRAQETRWKGNPLKDTIGVYVPTVVKEDGEEEYVRDVQMIFTTHMLKKVDSQTGTFIYEHPDGVIAHLSRYSPPTPDYDLLF